MSFSTTNNEDSLISRLNEVYAAGNLNILIGAGASVGSGFPNWDALSHSLLKAYFESVSDVGWDSSLDKHIDELSRTLGRDAIADFVWAGTGERFWELFSRVFYRSYDIDGNYRDRQVIDLPVRAIHRQLAALSDNAKIFTANYEPLVELAIAQRERELDENGRVTQAWRKYRSPLSLRDRLPKDFHGPTVRHIHGWIDPPPLGGSPPERHGHFVLTESHYIELTTNENAEPNQDLARIFAKDKVALIVGMSLNDPNIRRLMFLLSRPVNKDMGEVYAIVKNAGKLGRRSDDLFRKNLTEHWRNRGLTPIFVSKYDEIPTLLRDIQFGLSARPADPPKWIDPAIEWVESGVQPRGSVCFLNAWQDAAFRALNLLCEELSGLFRVSPPEKLSVELFAPLRLEDSVPRLYLLANSLGRRASTGMEARDRARRRALGITPGAPQGAAGLAFVRGLQLEVLNRGYGYNYNFDAVMEREWAHETIWRSILAVPVLDTRHFVPVAVVCVTSNEPDAPFWRRFGRHESEHQPELYKKLRSTAKYLLVDLQKDAVSRP